LIIALIKKQISADKSTVDFSIVLSSGEKEEKKKLTLLYEDACEFSFDIPCNITKEEYTDLLYYGERYSALMAAFRILEYGDNSTASLKKKLRMKGISSDAADFAVEKAEEMGYIDDASLLREDILRAANGKLYGKRRIFAEMMSKGYKREDISAALEILEGEIDYAENKKQLILRKYGEKRPESAEEAAKIKAFLYRYGY